MTEKRREKIPAWFNLKNYHDCYSFKAFDWLICLKTRRLTLEFISNSDIDGANDLADRTRMTPTDACCLGESVETPVKPLCFSDIAFKGGVALLALKGSQQAEHWTNTINALASGTWLPESMNRTPIEDSKDSSLSLVVNLDATDAVLTDAFSTWLKETRLQQRSGKRERPPYEKWADYGLLPYLDLLIWQKLTGNKITHQVMSEAVGYGNCAENFRKNTPLLAKRLMGNLNELEALAASEGETEKL